MLYQQPPYVPSARFERWVLWASRAIIVALLLAAMLNADALINAFLGIPS